jgi:hypothetical protein
LWKSTQAVTGGLEARNVRILLLKDKERRSKCASSKNFTGRFKKSNNEFTDTIGKFLYSPSGHLAAPDVEAQCYEKRGNQSHTGKITMTFYTEVPAKAKRKTENERDGAGTYFFTNLQEDEGYC